MKMTMIKESSYQFVSKANTRKVCYETATLSVKFALLVVCSRISLIESKRMGQLGGRQMEAKINRIPIILETGFGDMVFCSRSN